mgnify:CR=1 FL=1
MASSVMITSAMEKVVLRIYTGTTIWLVRIINYLYGTARMEITDNVRRRRLALAQAMKQRQRIEDDSDLIELVLERIKDHDGELIELELGNGGD